LGESEPGPVLLIELSGDVYTEADTDPPTHAEAIPSDSSDSGLESDENEDVELEETGQADPVFWRQSIRGVGTSWEHRKPPTESQALAALDEINGFL